VRRTVRSDCATEVGDHTLKGDPSISLRASPSVLRASGCGSLGGGGEGVGGLNWKGKSFNAESTEAQRKAKAEEKEGKDPTLRTKRSEWGTRQKTKKEKTKKATDEEGNRRRRKRPHPSHKALRVGHPARYG
jgi:hypothetical protein